MVVSKAKGTSKGALGPISIERGSEASGEKLGAAKLGTKDPSLNAILGGPADSIGRSTTDSMISGTRPISRESPSPSVSKQTRSNGAIAKPRPRETRNSTAKRARRLALQVPKSDPESERPHRLEYAVELVSPRKGYACRYQEAIGRIMEKFQVSRTTASEDMARAYDAVAQRVQALMPSLPARIRDQLESLAHECRRANTPMDRATASATLHRLGRLSGMVEGGEESQARRLTDDALNAAIAAEVAVRIDRMDTAELDDLLKRKQGRALAQASLAIDVTATELVAMPLGLELPSGDAGSEGG